MYILALDPGTTTGACVLNAGVDDFVVVHLREIPWESRLEMLEALIAGSWGNNQTPPQPPKVVVVEAFRLRQGRAFEQSGSEMPSSQVIAIIETFLYVQLRKHIKLDHLAGVLGDSSHKQYIAPQLVMQEPSSMSRVQILERDQELVKGSEHMKDAYKHARYYYVTKVRHQPTSVG